VLLDQVVLAIAQTAGFQQDLIGNADLANVVKISAAKERGEIFFAQLQRLTETRGVRSESLAMPIGVGIACFDHEREAHDDRLGRVEIVRVALEPHQ